MQQLNNSTGSFWRGAGAVHSEAECHRQSNKHKPTRQARLLHQLNT